jgi:tRNA (mo5U34)-methyltransferase
VHAVPTLDVLLEWLKQSGLKGAEILDVSKTTVEEQRSTEWMKFESLQASLDAKDHTLTVEGHAAPVRAAILVGV